jgi:hypothetical protein
LKARGIELVVARARKQLALFFAAAWVRQRDQLYGSLQYPTVKSAVHAFEKRAEGSPAPTDTDSGTEASETPQDAK